MNGWITPAPVPLQFSHSVFSDLLRGTKTFRQLHPSGRERLTVSSAKSVLSGAEICSLSFTGAGEDQGDSVQFCLRSHNTNSVLSKCGFLAHVSEFMVWLNYIFFSQTFGNSIYRVDIWTPNFSLPCSCLPPPSAVIPFFAAHSRK